MKSYEHFNFFGNLPTVEILRPSTYQENGSKKSLIENTSQPPRKTIYFSSRKKCILGSLKVLKNLILCLKILKN